MTLSRTLYASFVHLSVVATVNTIASLQLELLSTVKTCASLHITVKTHIHYENIPLLAPTVKATVKTFGPLQTYYPTMRSKPRAQNLAYSPTTHAPSVRTL